MYIRYNVHTILMINKYLSHIISLLSNMFIHIRHLGINQKLYIYLYTSSVHHTYTIIYNSNQNIKFNP